MKCHLEREARWRWTKVPPLMASRRPQTYEWSLLFRKAKPQTYERSLLFRKARPPAACRHMNEIWPTTCRAEELLSQTTDLWEIITNCFKSLGLGPVCYLLTGNGYRNGYLKLGRYCNKKNLTCVLLAVGSGRWRPQGWWGDCGGGWKSNKVTTLEAGERTMCATEQQNVLS